MSSAKITMMGYQNYMKAYSDDLFGGLTLPDGIDKDVLTNNILLKSADFEVIYSDPKFLKEAITLWGQKWYRTFDKWITALNIDFAPLENYDRIEEWTDSHTGSASSSGNDSSNTTSSALSKISAFNASTMQDDSSNSGESESTSTTAASTSDTYENTRTGRAHGNIGVTTSTQMLEDFLRVEEWNIYEHITDLFLSEFVILLY